eukprot:scaffold649_cov347-Pavlova_lutheri.AAC.107
MQTRETATIRTSRNAWVECMRRMRMCKRKGDGTKQGVTWWKGSLKETRRGRNTWYGREGNPNHPVATNAYISDEQ